jgi:hypothetical protein
MRSLARYRWLLMLPILLYLVACSRAELVYENADWLMYRWASGLVDATGEQRDAWRGRFDQLLGAHRERLLPDVVALLQAVETEAAHGLREQNLTCLLERTDELYRDHARLAIPLAVDILSEITPAQITHMADEIAERNADYAENYLADDPNERREARSERYIEGVERWTGRLDDVQRTLIKDAVATMPETAELWLAYRRTQQQKLLDLLRDGASPDQLTALLTAWWVEFDDRPSALETHVREVRQQSIALAVAVDASLQPTQRVGFIDRVVDVRAGLGNALMVASTSQPTSTSAAMHCG